MTGFLLVVIAFPVAVALLVNYLMKQDDKPKFHPPVNVRYFKTRKPTMVLCPAHLLKLKVGQVALVDKELCKVCLDTVAKKT